MVDSCLGVAHEGKFLLLPPFIFNRFWLLALELRRTEKVGVQKTRETEIKSWEERKVYRGHDVIMTVNLIKVYKSKMTNKNERREYVTERGKHRIKIA
jgi:hypothetical protein